MALSAGEKLGPYEIVGPLGAGGMGDVYRAHDSRLSREVAVKVLRGGAPSDGDALLRLQQEARTAGALNHPNLVTVFDVGERDGAPYVVTELLNGATLREVLKGRALPVKKAVEIARQVADGLAAAHESGVVHRDLKPENLFVMPDGRVKILDFGLAKRLSPNDSKGGEAQPTVPNLTEPGTILGTVAYMSPEQVRGRAVDHRSDVFSFGTVLYEMLAGRQPFLADSAVETMSAILNAEPPPIRSASGALPSGLERLVARCLEKDAGQRFQSSRDLAFHLSSLDAAANTVRLEEAPRASTAAGAPRWFRIAGLALAGAACALGGWLLPRAGRQPEISIHQLTFRRGTILSARFAPDGHTVVYSAVWNGKDAGLHAVTLDSPESRDLPLPGNRLASISKKGELAFLRMEAGSATGTLLRAPLAGGAPRELLESVASADWMPDDESLAVIRTVSGVSQLEVPAGKVLFRPVPANRLSAVRLSPDGSRIAFIDRSPGVNSPGTVCVADRNGRVRVLTSTLFALVNLAWSGDEIWFSATDGREAPWIQAVDLRGRRRTIYKQTHPLYLTHVAGGRALVIHTEERSEVVVHSRDAATARDVTWFDYTKPAGLSDDGTLLLFDEARLGSGKEGAVYLRRLDVEDPPVRLGPGRALALSLDKAWALTRRPAGPDAPEALVLLPTGPGENCVIPGEALNAFQGAFFPDGKRVLIRGNEPGGAERLFVKDLSTGSHRAVTPDGVVIWALSPDGKVLAAKATRGPLSLYSLDADVPPRKVGGVEPDEWPVRFGATENELFVSRLVERVKVEVTRVDVVTSRRGPLATVGPMDSAGASSVTRVLMTPDALRLVTASTKSLGELFVIEGLR